MIMSPQIKVKKNIPYFNYNLNFVLKIKVKMKNVKFKHL